MSAATITLDSTNLGPNANNLSQLSTNANSAGNTYRILNIGNGITLTITSFFLDTSNPNNTYQNSRTTLWDQGLGSCSTGETANNCGSDPQHRVDNNTRYEVMLFRFSAPVDVDGFRVAASCTVNSWNVITSCADTDATYWLADIPSNVTTLAGLTQTQVNNTFGASSNVDFDTSLNLYRSASITPNNYTDGFILGARLGQTNDYFKVKSIEVTFDPRIPGNEVPEPTTYALIGGALVALGIYRNKRRG